jgi:hypothetical protein
VHKGREPCGAWTAEGSKQDCAPVKDKGQRASNTHNEKLKIEFPRDSRCESAWCAHNDLLLRAGNYVTKTARKSQGFLEVPRRPQSAALRYFPESELRDSQDGNHFVPGYVSTGPHFGHPG